MPDPVPDKLTDEEREAMEIRRSMQDDTYVDFEAGWLAHRRWLAARGSVSLPNKNANDASDEFDDAVHIAVDHGRSTLCGIRRERRTVGPRDPRPNGAEGCWMCLLIADELTGSALSAAPSTGEGKRKCRCGMEHADRLDIVDVADEPEPADEAAVERVAEALLQHDAPGARWGEASSNGHLERSYAAKARAAIAAFRGVGEAK